MISAFPFILGPTTKLRWNKEAKKKILTEIMREPRNKYGLLKAYNISEEELQ